MAKCKVCTSRKGKRLCIYDNLPICSECCGTTRVEFKCSGCDYFSFPSRRRYQDVEYYSSNEMQNDLDLQSLSNTIEASLCLFDMNNNKSLNDLIVLKILENLLDKYYFKDENIRFENEIVKSGFLLLDGFIQSDLADIEEAQLCKIIAVVRFVAKRRTTGKRNYLDFIHEYVGIRAGSGIRLMNL